MKALVKNAHRDSVKYMEELSPDAVISTHWATNYYAMHTKNPPFTAMYIPDAHANPMFRYPCDLLMIPIQEGYENGLKKYKRRLNEDNFKKVPLAIREEAFSVNLNKSELRKKLGHDDKFTVYMAEGDYGIGLLEKINSYLLSVTCNFLEKINKRLIEEDLPISLVVICGKNPDLYQRVASLKSKGNLSFYPYGFCDNILEQIASSDLYLGKSGSGLLEIAFFGVPMVITHSANEIEKLIAEHYVSHVKNAVRIFDVEKSVEFIKQAYKGEGQYNELKANVKPRSEYGGEGIADCIFEKLNEKFHLTD